MRTAAIGLWTVYSLNDVCTLRLAEQTISMPLSLSPGKGKIVETRPKVQHAIEHCYLNKDINLISEYMTTAANIAQVLQYLLFFFA